MILRKMCLKYKCLPPSCVVPDGLRRIGGYPCGVGGNADVWRGVYRGYRVAIKVLRVNLKDLVSLEKVRLFVSILHFVQRKRVCVCISIIHPVTNPHMSNTKRKPSQRYGQGCWGMPSYS